MGVFVCVYYVYGGHEKWIHEAVLGSGGAVAAGGSIFFLTFI